jgi:hypothetical protein
MMQPDDQGRIPFREALITVLNMFKGKAAKGVNDLLGLMFFNTVR